MEANPRNCCSQGVPGCSDCPAGLPWKYKVSFPDSLSGHDCDTGLSGGTVVLENISNCAYEGRMPGESDPCTIRLNIVNSHPSMNSRLEVSGEKALYEKAEDWNCTGSNLMTGGGNDGTPWPATLTIEPLWL